VKNERDPNARGWRVRLDQNPSPFESLGQIGDRKGNVRDGFHDLGHLAVGLEAHPLDPIGTGLESTNVDAEVFEVLLPSVTLGARYADMVISPAEDCRRPGWFIVAASPSHGAVLRSVASLICISMRTGPMYSSGPQVLTPTRCVNGICTSFPQHT